MSSISLKSGKREAGVKQFFADMKENPITFFLICILTFSLLSYFSPLGGFFIRHHELFGVIVAVSVVPTGVFIWVLYMKYEDKKFMEKYNEKVKKIRGQKLY